VERRGKYLLLRCPAGHLIIHLGMSGHLQVLAAETPPGKHDHLDIVFANGSSLRFTDPRRFGAILWTIADPLQHPLLAGIGPEPLSETFTGTYLLETTRNRKVTIKQLVMNSSVVAGVGNIYANEALFHARIRPDRVAGTLTHLECSGLAAAIRQVLEESIGEGSTCRVAEETVAYYPQAFKVYGRGGEPCQGCGKPLEEIRLGGRSTVFCRRCQE